MEPRNTLGLGKKPAGPQKWKVTLTGPAKGMPPVTIIAEAASGKSACEGLKKLFLYGKLTVDAV